MNDRDRSTRWIDYLSDEDLQFLRRFLLASGSLKELASAYDISYPTVRLRLDRLIQKVQLVEQDAESEFERVLRAEYADGHLDLGTLKRLLAAHERDEAAGKESGDEKRVRSRDRG